MASYYVRKDSPYYWVRFQKPGGTWGSKSSGIRTDKDGAIRKVKQFAANLTMKEVQPSETGHGNRFDAWVPQFIKTRYSNIKTQGRYLIGWSAISTYLEYRQIIAPAQVDYKSCVDYLEFRTSPPKGLIKGRSHNTALTELKIFSAILQESVRRGYITANPGVRLGIKRNPPKQKHEITPEEEIQIEEALTKQAEWMQESWLVAMRQGCRISETACPLRQIDRKQKTISFIAKGNRIHTAPLHEDLLGLVDKAFRQKRESLVNLPIYAPKKWSQFLKRIGLGHLSFHCTRVTVVTKLARNGYTSSQAKAYVGHASDTVHAIYQRLSPTDVRGLGAALSSPSAGNRDSASANPEPKKPSKPRRA